MCAGVRWSETSMAVISVDAAARRETPKRWRANSSRGATQLGGCASSAEAARHRTAVDSVAEGDPRVSGATPTLRGSKDLIQFAPNFSVYVLPPDAVCLYS